MKTKKDIWKKAGIFALTEGVKILALREGVLGGSTIDRLAILQEKGILSKEIASDIEASYSLLTFLRLRGQIASAAAGKEVTNYILPGSLNRVEKGRLKLALEVVKSFQGVSICRGRDAKSCVSTEILTAE